MDRVIIIDKPAGMTSHDVVQHVRRAIRQRRVGHAGTLDPSATGVLVVLTGRATRLSQFLTAADKEYRGRIVLGTATDTHDADGTVLSTGDCSAVTEDEVRDCLAAFTGDLMQVPPMVSAVKKEGRPLYELAREGLEVEREARPIHIAEFELIAFEPPEILFRVVCSKGTYVRTLAADIGERLGCGAHLGELRRTRSGVFTEGEAVALTDLGASAKGGALVGRSLYEALIDLPSVTLGERQLDQILEGQPAREDACEWPVGALVRITPDGRHLTAIARVGEPDGEGRTLLRPIRVFGEDPDERRDD